MKELYLLNKSEIKSNEELEVLTSLGLPKDTIVDLMDGLKVIKFEVEDTTQFDTKNILEILSKLSQYQHLQKQIWINLYKINPEQVKELLKEIIFPSENLSVLVKIFPSYDLYALLDKEGKEFLLQQRDDQSVSDNIKLELFTSYRYKYPKFVLKNLEYFDCKGLKVEEYLKQVVEYDIEVLNRIEYRSYLEVVKSFDTLNSDFILKHGKVIFDNLFKLNIDSISAQDYMRYSLNFHELGYSQNLEDLRNTLIDFLFEKYEKNENQLEIINFLENAWRHPEAFNREPSQKLTDMVNRNTQKILEWIDEKKEKMSLPVLKEIKSWIYHFESNLKFYPDQKELIKRLHKEIPRLLERKDKFFDLLTTDWSEKYYERRINEISIQDAQEKFRNELKSYILELNLSKVNEISQSIINARKSEQYDRGNMINAFEMIGESQSEIAKELLKRQDFKDKLTGELVFLIIGLLKFDKEIAREKFLELLKDVNIAPQLLFIFRYSSKEVYDNKILEAIITYTKTLPPQNNQLSQAYLVSGVLETIVARGAEITEAKNFKDDFYTLIEEQIIHNNLQSWSQRLFLYKEDSHGWIFEKIKESQKNILLKAFILEKEIEYQGQDILLLIEKNNKGFIFEVLKRRIQKMVEEPVFQRRGELFSYHLNERMETFIYYNYEEFLRIIFRNAHENVKEGFLHIYDFERLFDEVNQTKVERVNKFLEILLKLLKSREVRVNLIATVIDHINPEKRYLYLSNQELYEELFIKLSNDKDNKKTWLKQAFISLTGGYSVSEDSFKFIFNKRLEVLKKWDVSKSSKDFQNFYRDIKEAIKNERDREIERMYKGEELEKKEFELRNS